MALLVHRGSEARIALPAHALAGRSSACTVRVSAPRASAEHASLSYRAGAWTLRDLGSTNGTFVNGERLDRGGARALAAGDEIAFGDAAEVWRLADASAPVALARRLSDGAVLAAAEGLLALPPADGPLVCVVETEPGQWTVEEGSMAHLAADGEIISSAGHAYMLHLPAPVPLTVEQAQEDRRLTLGDCALGLRVSRDEETVEVSLRRPDGLRVLSPRAHHYTLLTLARLRVRPGEDAALGDEQRGWVSADDLCRMLGIDELKLNVEIYRIRREIASLGLVDAAQIVERRRGSRQLRLGAVPVTIGDLP